MGCKCITSNDDENKEISKNSQEDNIYEIYQGFNPSDQNNSNENNNNYDENDIINNLIKSDINYENENNENTKISKNSKYANYSEKIVELINNIRQEPSSYAEIIENSMINIFPLCFFPRFCASSFNDMVNINNTSLNLTINLNIGDDFDYLDNHILHFHYFYFLYIPLPLLYYSH